MPIVGRISLQHLLSRQAICPRSIHFFTLFRVWVTLLERTLLARLFLTTWDLLIVSFKPAAVPSVCNSFVGSWTIGFLWSVVWLSHSLYTYSVSLIMVSVTAWYFMSFRAAAASAKIVFLTPKARNWIFKTEVYECLAPCDLFRPSRYRRIYSEKQVNLNAMGFRYG